MKKDIEIPRVTGVFVAAVREENKEFRSMDWNAYLINEKNVPLEMVLIVARGYDGKESTSTMRHTIKVLPAKSFAKIEYMQDDVLRLRETRCMKSAFFFQRILSKRQHKRKYQY